MNYDLILLFAFGLVLLGIMFLNKERVKVEKILFPLVYMVLYRTKVGLLFMDKIAKKYPRIAGAFAFLSIVFGFIGMIAILVLLINGIYEFLFAGAPPPVAPIFPGVKTIPGVPIISFFHWIIAIFILAGVHEFSHGLIARLYNVKVKSSGFAVFSFFLPIIPAAFVEPDEKELASKKNREQLGVLAAGSFANFITMLIALLFLNLLLTPLLGSTIHREGTIVGAVSEGSPANLSGITIGEEILEVNGIKIDDVETFLTSIEDIKVGDKIDLVTNVSSYSLIAADPPKTFPNKIMFWKFDNGYLGISPLHLVYGYKEGLEVIGNILYWIFLLFFWIYAANLGVGLFNLLPMGPLDGGKMFYLVCMKFFKKEDTAKKVWLLTSFFCLGLIVISLIPFLIRFARFIFVGLIWLF